ncbi:hypothetical protein [Desulfoscipio gibsoniae]|nr:hypothetical protein [Desulfoscipio gibsoniae]
MLAGLWVSSACSIGAILAFLFGGLLVMVNYLGIKLAAFLQLIFTIR